MNVTYGTNANYKGYVVPTSKENTKIRNVSMSHEDFAKLQNSFANSSSSAKYAIELSGRCGLRVSECSKLQGRDIVLNGDNSYINVKNSKGGRSRQVPINKSDMAYFTELKEQFGDTTQRICPAQPNSINKAINRHMQQIGLDKKYKDTSIHSLRKMYAQDQFNNLREQGYSIQESMGKVSVLLGHSEDRETLMREYILDIK